MIKNFRSVSLDQFYPIYEYIFIKNKHKIILFNGEIGVGKTTLIKFFLKMLEVKETVVSPTFSIINEYKSNDGRIINHFDLFRVKSQNEIQNLGITEYLESSNYCLIEWPNLLIDLIDEEYIIINIYRNNEIERDLEILIN
tara:strand:+ start:1257 stop:1679 length:423 start_codon:yes stop_codon:yes gene_type:complete